MNNEGFDPEKYISNLETENTELRSKNSEIVQAYTSQGFSPEEEQNLIQYQLETDKILERIEHFLRGDVIAFSKDGSYFDEPTKNILAKIRVDPKTGITYYIQELKENTDNTEIKKNILVKIINKGGSEIDVLEHDSPQILRKLQGQKLINKGYKYVKIPDQDKKPLNEYGVAEFMRIISMYVTKETFLSYYTEERIFEIMGDLGDALNNFLYCNYEKMGMDTKFKESKYTIMILNILHTVESCYRRAIGGAEQYNLRSRSIVTQSQGGSSSALNLAKAGVKTKKWNPLKPSTW